MIGSIAALLILQLIGTIIIQLTGIPLPGPVVGMLILFAYLVWRGGTPRPFERTAQGLLQNLALLFVPAGVGVLTHLHEVADQWLALSITIALSTAITMVVSAATLHWLMRIQRSRRSADPE